MNADHHGVLCLDRRNVRQCAGLRLSEVEQSEKQQQEASAGLAMNDSFSDRVEEIAYL